MKFTKEEVKEIMGAYTFVVLSGENISKIRTYERKGDVNYERILEIANVFRLPPVPLYTELREATEEEVAKFLESGGNLCYPSELFPYLMGWKQAEEGEEDEEDEEELYMSMSYSPYGSSYKEEYPSPDEDGDSEQMRSEFWEN